MKALLYLMRTKLKNQLKSLIRKPGRLIYALFLLACLILVLVGGSAAYRVQNLRPAEELAAIALALYALMFLIGVNAGFSKGGSLFCMPDVNLLFTAPLRTQTVLFYGLFQQMGTSLLLGFFLLFQYAWLRSTYGVTLPQLLGLLLGYSLAAFLGQVTAMVVYAFTSAEERRQRLCRTAVYAVVGCFAVYLAVASIPGGQSGLLARAAAVSNGPVLRAFPVAGWLSMAVYGMLTESWNLLLPGLGLCAAYGGVLVAVLVRGKPDFYEDAIQSAETMQSAINAKKEGTMSDGTPRRVKVGRKGLSGGWGASAFYYKHRLENRRGKRFFLGGNGLVFALAVIGYAWLNWEGGWLSVFVMATYLQLFTVMTGRFHLELSRPYLYLVPESPMKKLLWSLAETLPSATAEALVIFVPVALLLLLSPAEGAACILARISYAVLYTAADVTVQRLWGGVASRMLVMLLFLAVFLGLALPGIVLSFIAALGWGFTAAGALGVLAAANLPMALLALFLCRNMLQYAEVNNQ